MLKRAIDFALLVVIKFNQTVNSNRNRRKMKKIIKKALTRNVKFDIFDLHLRKDSKYNINAYLKV